MGRFTADSTVNKVRWLWSRKEEHRRKYNMFVRHKVNRIILNIDFWQLWESFLDRLDVDSIANAALLTNSGMMKWGQCNRNISFTETWRRSWGAAVVLQLIKTWVVLICLIDHLLVLHNVWKGLVNEIKVLWDPKPNYTVIVPLLEIMFSKSTNSFYPVGIILTI